MGSPRGHHSPNQPIRNGERGSDRGQSSSQGSDGEMVTPLNPRGSNLRPTSELGTGAESSGNGGSTVTVAAASEGEEQKLGKAATVPWLLSAQIRSSSV